MSFWILALAIWALALSAPFWVSAYVLCFLYATNEEPDGDLAGIAGVFMAVASLLTAAAIVLLS